MTATFAMILYVLFGSIRSAPKPHPEINHPSHPQHPLLLTKDLRGDDPCDFCGHKLWPPCYSCTTCEFKVDLMCGMKPSPSSIEHPMCHDHPLVLLKKREEEALCDICKVSIDGASYLCLECHVNFHVDCVHLSIEVNHPCHSIHPLKLTTYEELVMDTCAENSCFFCQRYPKYVLYHCSICNFTSCLDCTKNPPPRVIEHTKTHEHPLTLFSRKISSTCNSCGEENDMDRFYLCLQCDFSIHANCIDLPRVININRHDHKISFSHHLGRKNLECGVCRTSLSQYHGAYSCSACSNYAVHSRCAVKRGVWDGSEMEGIVNDDDIEDISPFKVMGENLISHFSHDKHTLRLQKNNNVYDDECTRCEACIHPIGFDSFYSCKECRFFLHEKCANLPMKKKITFDIVPYMLENATGFLDCKVCKTFSDGFKYTSRDKLVIDVHCGSLSEPFVHDSHLHPLYFGFGEEKERCCAACKKAIDGYMLCCDTCGFDLCLFCASLPEKIWHKSDEHPLTLCYSNMFSNNISCCEFCETELELSQWFYTCSSDCGATMHVNCVVGDFTRLMPGSIIKYNESPIEVALNNHSTRPICSMCFSRCKVSVILKHVEDNKYICSRQCFFNLFSGG